MEPQCVKQYYCNIANCLNAYKSYERELGLNAREDKRGKITHSDNCQVYTL